MKDLDKIAFQGYRARLNSGISIEDILAELRKEGFSVIESIKAVVSLQDVTLQEAKKLVHLSETWKDLRSTHDSFHEGLEKSISTSLGNLPNEQGLIDDTAACI
jgi:hypothetical protein